MQLKKKKHKTPSMLGHAIRRLTRVREDNGSLVNSDIRFHIEDNKPENLKDPIRLAVELDAYCKIER